MMCPHGQGGGLELVGTFCGQEGGSIFHSFMQTSFMDGPFIEFFMRTILINGNVCFLFSFPMSRSG